MIGDDITPLLAPRLAESPFRQGVLATFDAGTGENTVTVNGATLTNVPLLASDAGIPALTAGDVVILIRLRSSWAVLGRVVIPTP